jgi:carbonic anhydrase
VRVIGAGDTAELEQVRQFFRNYAAWLGVDLCFQNFDEEMATLPGRYAAPQGRLFYAEVDGKGAGCVGIRPFAEGACELKRLYVDPAQRGLGIGRLLALAAIRAARELGYRSILLDTLPAMRIAVKLYRELGFLEAPAYYQTPLEGTQFLALDL